MPERPLLLFPTPEPAGRSNLPGGTGKSHRPSHGRQGQRLSPIFTQLQTAFNTRSVEIQQTTAGVDPEQVLVIETIGNVENFFNAVKRIEGLEWMGEFETDEIAPDDDFYDESNPQKDLTGRLYLVMSNNRALDEMLSLWRRYQEDENIEFEWGLGKFKQVFLYLKDIRRWEVQDRIGETGVLEAWLEDLEQDGERPVRSEIELWYRGTQVKRAEARKQLESLIEDIEGKILEECVIPDIAYHALLTEIPANAAEQIAKHPEVGLMKCDSVMFFRPVGQMATGKELVEGELSDHEASDLDVPTGEPVVAILDGLPMANHRLLQNRLVIDDPDDYTAEYTVVDRTHGTAMASLIAHGDLNDGASPLSRLIYVRPVMKPIPWYQSPRPEQIPDSVLVTDYIHRAVRRMFDGDGANGPVAPSIRIVNFSIGDSCRQFTQVLSPLARLLDWLSVKYHVLFVISAGNHIQLIETGLSKADFNALSETEKEAQIVKALHSDTRHRKLLSPAEGINGITVGALHHDNAPITKMGHAVDLYENPLPSTVSAFGSGYRRSIKPDIVVAGGRLLHSEMFGTTNAVFEPLVKRRVSPGNMVASPSAVAGELTKAAFCCGTSNAAALATRMAAECYDALLEIFEEQAPEIEKSGYLASILKTMVIHGSSWGDTGDRLRSILQTPDNGRQIRNLVSRWLGYGVPDGERVLACTEQRATLLGFGYLNDKEAHVFTLPLPPSLGARRDWRRLTVTLAWLSPIAATTQRYRSVSLWFEVEGGAVAPKREEAEWRAVRRGTVQHEVFEGNQAVPINDDTNLTIKVNCRKDAAKIQEPVAYGLAVTLEVAEGVDIAIYEEIRTRIAPPVEIRAEGGT